MSVTAIFLDDTDTAIDGTNPLEAEDAAGVKGGPLNADDDEVGDWQRVTVILPVEDPAKVTTGDVVIGFSGAGAANWQLAPDNAGAPDEGNAAAYGANLTIATPIDDTTGVDVWVRAKATSGESAAEDTSVTLVVVSGEVVAA